MREALGSVKAVCCVDGMSCQAKCVVPRQPCMPPEGHLYTATATPSYILHLLGPGICALNRIVPLMDDEEALKRHTAWSDEQGDGYPSLANFIAQDPDSEALVFRKFKRLATENILYLQGELIKLEDDFDAWESDAAAGVARDPQLFTSMRSWKVLNEQASDTNRTLERRRADLAKLMEAKIKSYCQFAQGRSCSEAE
jgi:hypothetical protein